MTAQSVTCPPESMLSDFGLGKLDAAKAETVSRHLETCADCRRRAASLSGDSFVGRSREADGAAKPVAGRERTDLPGESLADAASSTDGSLMKEDGLPGPSRTLGDAGNRDGLRRPSSVSSPPELANHPDYELIKELGRGGMGTVYLAKNRMMDRLEVLKVISKSLVDRPGALERFQQEIRSAAKLAHPNIVAAYSVLRPGDLLVFAMEYVRGQDLAAVVKARGGLPVANATFYIHQVALGLQHAHEKGMVHRDIKPNNLMLAIEGKRHVVKILDFGLAKATSEKGAEAGLTKSGQMLGTPDYIAPEQTLDAHKADIRADIYSLGCTLYFLLSGSPPFQETSLFAILKAHHELEPEPLNLVRPEVPAELGAVVAKMMAKDPTKRYQTPSEVARALVPFFKPGQSVATAPPGDIAQAQPEAETEYRLSASTFTSRTTPATPPPAPGRLPADKAATFQAPTVALGPPAAATASRRVAKATPVATKRSRPSAKPRFWSNLLPVGIGIALSLATIAIVLSAVEVFRVRTADGILVVEVNEPNPDVYVDGEKVTVAWQDGGVKAEVGVKPGTRKVELKKDGFRVYGQEVTLEHHGRTVLVARLDPLAPGEEETTTATRAPTFKNSLGMEFVLVPKGKSWLGGGGGRPGDKEVDIADDFYLGKYEVTQEEWKKVTGLTPSWFSRTGGGQGLVQGIAEAELNRFPVENVSWDDVQKFLERLNTQEQKAGWVYRLPLAAEWEYACRGGPLSDKRESAYDYYFDKPTNQLLRRQANVNKDLQRTWKVGSYLPNRLGLYDMHGNVWEWCNDPERTFRGVSSREPRGGGWSTDPRACTVAFRRGPAQWEGRVGLRLARCSAE